jgi:hypothetical protein
MYNNNLLPDYDETILIDCIHYSEKCIVDLNKQLLARLRISGYGEIVINSKNELVSGAEGLILAIESGQKEVNVKRVGPISLKNRK